MSQIWNKMGSYNHELKLHLIYLIGKDEDLSNYIDYVFKKNSRK